MIRVETFNRNWGATSSANGPAHTHKITAVAHRYAKLDKKMSQQLQKTRDYAAAVALRGR